MFTCDKSQSPGSISFIRNIHDVPVHLELMAIGRINLLTFITHSPLNGH